MEMTNVKFRYVELTRLLLIEVCVVVELRISDLWAVLPCHLVDGYQSLRRETKREAEACSSKTLKPSSDLNYTAEQKVVIKQSMFV
jgi:hypothetical protein